MQVTPLQKAENKRNLAQFIKTNVPLHLAAVLLIELFSYRHLFSISFLSDDFLLLQKNLQWIDPGKGFFRPLPKLIMLSLHGLFGAHPFVFHLMSFLIHYANALLIYFILQKLLRNRPAALMGSALFVSNYLSSEAVFWISSTNTILGTLFILLGIYSYASYLSSGKAAYNLQALACLALGLLSNENAIVLPVLLFILPECHSPTRGNIPFAGKSKGLAGHVAVIFLYVLAKAPSLAANISTGTLSIGYHMIRNLRFMLLSLFTFNPFNDLPFVYLDTELLNVFLKDPIKKLNPDFAWSHFYFPLLLGAMIIVFCVYVLLKGGTGLKHAFLAFLASTLPVIMLSTMHLPFAGYYRYPLRLFYFPASLFMIFLAIALSNVLAWLRKKSGLGISSAVLGILLFGLVLGESMKTNGRNSDWLKASDIARSILGQFEKIMDSNPATKRVVLFNMPDSYHGAYIFKNGFAAAAQLYFPAVKTKIEVSGSMPGDAGKLHARERGLLLLDCTAGKLTPVAN
jgi:hypothetical protein